jgi:hypothetical protein
MTRKARKQINVISNASTPKKTYARVFDEVDSKYSENWAPGSGWAVGLANSGEAHAGLDVAERGE